MEKTEELYGIWTGTFFITFPLNFAEMGINEISKASVIKPDYIDVSIEISLKKKTDQEIEFQVRQIKTDHSEEDCSENNILLKIDFNLNSEQLCLQLKEELTTVNLSIKNSTNISFTDLMELKVMVYLETMYKKDDAQFLELIYCLLSQEDEDFIVCFKKLEFFMDNQDLYMCKGKYTEKNCCISNLIFNIVIFYLTINFYCCNSSSLFIVTTFLRGEIRLSSRK